MELTQSNAGTVP